MYVPLGKIVTVPFVGDVTGVVVAVRICPEFGSKSLLNKLPVTGIPTLVCVTSGKATGGAFTPGAGGAGKMVIVTKAVSHFCGVKLSQTLYLKVSVPE